MEDSPEYIQKKRPSYFKPLFYSFLISLTVAALSIFIYDRYFALKVVAFDISGFVSQQKKQFYAGKITEAERLRSLDRVDAARDIQNKSTLILNGNAVIRNAKFIEP